MKVPLTGGLFAIVDDEDSPLVSKYRWHVKQRVGSNGFTIRTHIRAGVGLPLRRVTMPKLLMGERPGFEIDHRNRNTLDNRRANLRWATRRQQNANRACPNETGYKGIVKNGRWGWAARFTPTGRKTIYLGTFKTPEIAAEAYRQAALKEWGEFACFDVRARKRAKV